MPGNSTALFNAPAIAEGGSPLVVCEGPLDALSFIEAGWERTLALHNTDPSSSFWEAIRGSVDAVLFAFDADETGRKDAQARVREAKMKAYKADTLHDKPTYAGYEDPNEALQAGDLSLHYLRELSEETPAEASEQPVEGAKHEEVLTPSSNQRGADGPDSDYEPSDLISYWNGSSIGYLGRWIWERSPAPMGEAGKGLYADQALHEWIATELQAGPKEAENPERLRRVLWRLYATFGPEDITEEVVQHHCDDVPEQSRSGSVWRDRDRDPYRVGRLPSSVEVWRVTAPKEPRATSERGIAIDSPYSEAFIQDLKVLPEWGREWRGSEKVWVVDDCFAAFAGDLLRSHFAT